MNKLEAEVKLAEPFKTKFYFKHPVGLQTTSILLPHEVFASIYHHYPEAWAILGTFTISKTIYEFIRCSIIMLENHKNSYTAGIRPIIVKNHFGTHRDFGHDELHSRGIMRYMNCDGFW